MIRSAVNAGVSLPAAALRLLDTASSAAVPDALKTLASRSRRASSHSKWSSSTASTERRPKN
jgi:hypothetical protein